MDKVLTIAATVVGIAAVLFPIAAGAAMWKMSEKFATRSSLRNAVKYFDKRVNEKVTQLERDIERSHSEVMRAIAESREAVRVDINGLGDRITGIQRVAELATSQADNARHEGDLLREQVKSIDEHGTKKAAMLEQQISALTSNLTLFNKLIEQGILQPSQGSVAPKSSRTRGL